MTKIKADKVLVIGEKAKNVKATIASLYFEIPADARINKPPN
jgi:hypothetical protein